MRCYVRNFPKRRMRANFASLIASRTIAMTKSDFSLMVVRPIFVAALLCAYPTGRAVTLPSLPHFLLGASLLTLPLVLWYLSSKRAG